jgi:AraC-like DNA-binding protein
MSMSDWRELTFLHGGRMPRCTARLDKHFAGYFSLQLGLGGEIRLSYDQQHRILRGPCFWPCMPGPRIRFRSAREGRSWDHRHIAFRGPLVGWWQKEGLWPAPVVSDPPHVERMTETFDRMIHFAFESRGRRLDHLRAANLLERILLDLASSRQSSQPGKEDEIDRIAARLAANPQQNPDYPALAEEFDLSLSTLRKQFRRKMGMGIHTFLLQARMAEARKLLLTTDLPIKAVAARLGFRDVYYFSRQFKKIAGVPPGRFRQSGRL